MRKFAFLFIICLIVLSRTALAKSYHYDSIKTDLNLSSDGSVIVSQERDYDFSGSFTYAYLDVLKKGATNVKFLSIVDMDTGKALNYNLDDEPSHVQATWYYSASDQVKRFLITYEIEGAVKRYQDVADFYWKVIEDTHESINSFQSDVNLPAPSSNLFKIFVHSSASPGKILFSNSFESATVTMQNIPANTFVEFRVLTDPSIFTGVNQIAENKYQSILNEESVNFQVSSFTNSLSFWIIILVVIPVLIFLYFYLRYGREPKVDYQLKYEQEPPRDIPPMALSTLYLNYPILKDSARKNLKFVANFQPSQVSIKGLIATIFDLARRGYIDVREEEKEHLLGLVEKKEQIFTITKKGRTSLSSSGDLLNFETSVLQLLFEDASKGKDEISSSELSKWCRENRYKVQDRISEMVSDSRDWFEKSYFKIYEAKSLKESKKFLIVMLIYFFLIFAPLIYFNLLSLDSRLIIFLVVITIITLTAATYAVDKRTPEATLEVKKWNAFKRYISDFSAMKDAPLTLLQIWDRYLIYAVVLDVAKELLKNIKDLCLERHAPVAAVYWYHPIGVNGMPSGMMSPEAFDSFSSNMNGMISALSSSSSVGGGFSGGGGGGGGGGGSGAG